ncbi:MAG: nucleotidyltransferase family protein [Thermodesulfobacteriota bacterium]
MTWLTEDKLLLLCCQTEISGKDIDWLIEIQRDKIDWDYFLEKARGEGISPLVFIRLPKVLINKNYTPKYVTDELRKDYYLSASKNTLIFNELRNILKVLNKAGLRVIVLKGAALAEMAYGNLALRPMSDVDLLVKKEDLFSINEHLEGIGYFPSDRSLDGIDFTSTYLTTLDYRNASTNSPSFHIHWHFVNSTIPNDSYINNIKMEDIWQDAQKASVASVETLVMAPHHLIIHLSEHALRVTHSLSKLSLLCDINEAINSYQDRLDWDRLIKYSLKFKLDRMVYIALYFVSGFIASKIPERALLGLMPKHFTLGERIFINAISNNDRPPGLSYLVHLSMNRGLFRKVRFVGRTFFPPRHIIAQRRYIQQSRISYMDYLRRVNEVFLHCFRIVIILGKSLAP